MPRKLTNIEKVLKFLPASIKLAEAATLPGPKKKALALATAAGTIPLPPKEKAALGVVIDAIVTAFNIAGLFIK
jgi:hypothetical protein